MDNGIKIQLEEALTSPNAKHRTTRSGAEKGRRTQKPIFCDDLTHVGARHLDGMAVTDLAAERSPESSFHTASNPPHRPRTSDR